MPSIAIAEGSDLRYQGVVRFETDAGKLKGNAWPMVLVSAHATKAYGAADVPHDWPCSGTSGSQDGIDDGELIYGELVKPTADGIATVTLGGGGSLWAYCLPGEPAHCTAALYSYNRQGDIELLAGPIEFDAAGA